jgi:2-desacetyl-2-hydroxyethyl bacteriochlorophyllide A dehydrogenase
MKDHAIVFTAKRKAEFPETELDENLLGDEIPVKDDYDLISAGTELANYRELPNTVAANRGFPHTAGYSASGHVVAVGPESKLVKVGDRVVVNWGGHHAWFKRSETRVVKIPDGVDMKCAAYAHLASFPMLAVRRLKIEIGESVMVAGLGLLGQFAVQFARLAGAYPVLACDYSPERRELAKRLGADMVFDPREADLNAKVKTATDGKGPAAVVEVTGFISALQQALEYVAANGRIALLGCTRVSDRYIDFYKYVHRRGVQLIGAHTMTRPKFESRPGEWTEHDDYTAFLKLLKAGRIQVAPLIGKVAPASEAVEIYRELDEAENPPLGVLLDWTGVE